MLEQDSQRFFAESTHEYPLTSEVEAEDALPPLDEIDSPDIDLSDLSDLQGTLRLMQTAGAL